MSETKRTIEMLKKCRNQPLIFQMLYSHLGWVLTNELKIITTTNLDTISIILIYGSMCQKCPNKNIEQSMINFLKKNRIKSKIDFDIEFKLIIVVCYFLNQTYENINLHVLSELMHNFLYMNDFLDFLILKFLAKYTLGFLYQTKTKKKIQNDIIETFLKKIEYKKLGMASQANLLICYLNTKIIPFNFVLVDNVILRLKFLEAFSCFAAYSKNELMIKSFIGENKIFLQLFEQYLEMNIMDTFNYKNIYLKDFFIENNDLYRIINKFYMKSQDKLLFLKNLDEIKNLLENEI